MSSSIKIFFAFFVFFLIMGTLVFLTGAKGEFVLLLDEHHSLFLDLVFRFFTFLGDGVWFAILIVLFLFIRYSSALAFVALGIIQLILVQGLKRNVFGRVPRPAEYFKDVHQFNSVEGIDIHHFYSFPSGHTATAFGIATMLIFLLRPGKVMTAVIFLMATLVGISRIYLAQHFLEDVLAGALLGVLSASVVWWSYWRIELKNPGAGIFNSSLRDKF